MTRREEIGCFREACPESNKRPDISVFNMPNVHRKLILDVSVTSPVVNQSTREISRAQALTKERIAKQRFNAKITKYQAISTANNLEFLPIIIESTGGLHSKAADFFFKVIDHIAGYNKSYKVMCHLFWAARISCQLQKSISNAILTKTRAINGHLTSDRSYQLTSGFVGNFPVARGS